MAMPTADQVGSDLDRPLTLHTLTYLTEGDEVTVGCPRTDSYAVLPPDGAELVHRLEEGMSPRAAANWYERSFGEKVDIRELLAALTELRFVADPSTAEDAPPRIRWQRLGAAVFSRPALACYAALVIVAVGAMVAVPQVRFSYRNIFFTPYLTVIEIVVFAGQIAGLFVHESFHALAGRRLGLRSSLRISRRLYFVVFETRLDGLVSVPARRRYLPILAGMLADAVVTAALVLAAALTRRADGDLSFAGGLCMALALSTFIRLLWQFYFYLQTDLYYLAITVLGCRDLQRVAKQMLLNRFWRLLRRPDRVLDESAWFPRDRAVARWYSWLLLAGYSAAIGTLVLVAVPAMWRVWRMMALRMVEGGQPLASVTDGAVFLALNLVNFGLIGISVARGRRRRRQQSPPSHVLD